MFLPTLYRAYEISTKIVKTFVPLYGYQLEILIKQ